MRNEDGVLVPQPNVMEPKLRRICTMHDEIYAQIRFGQYCTNIAKVG